MDSVSTSWRIIYFGTDWNAENRTSVHHIARGLARHHELLYFECPGLRAPSGTSGRDLRRIFGKLAAAWAPPRHPMPNVTVRTLLQLPFHRLPGMKAVNRFLLHLQVHRAIKSARWNRPDIEHTLISWFVAPHVASLAGRIDEELVVYYCVDDFAAFPGVDAQAVKRWEDRLCAAADVVFVSSATLIDSMSRRNRNVVHSPHGVEVDHFARARTRSDVRPGLLPDSGPIIGFFGLVAEWIDLDLVGRLASKHPEWQFVMIGRIAVIPDSLPQLPNLRFIGQVPYDRLPEYGAFFDVAIIPYRLTRQVLHANPIKLREYLAMAKPIVTVSTPEIDLMGDHVTIAATDAEWEDGIRSALTGQDPEARIARQAAVSRTMSWEARLDMVQAEVGKLLKATR